MRTEASDLKWSFRTTQQSTCTSHACHCCCDMEYGVTRRLNGRVDETARTGQSAERQAFESRSVERGCVAGQPCGAKQTSLTRIVARHGHTLGQRIRHDT